MPSCVQLGIEMFTALLSQFMHGEQGAMMTAAKIVDTVPWIDAKYYAATQTMDEARHTEVFARYIDEKVGEAYPMNPYLEAQIIGLLEDSRWDIAYLGMQIVIESLALAAFGDMARRTEEPLLKQAPPLRHGRRGPPRRLRDPLARRVLRAPVGRRAQGPPGLPPRAHGARPGPLDHPRGVGADGGAGGGGGALHHGGGAADWSRPRSRTSRTGSSPSSSRTSARLGLLDANDGYLRERWGAAGLLEFEFADDTSADYDTYDAVAADRSAGGD